MPQGGLKIVPISRRGGLTGHFLHCVNGKKIIAGYPRTEKKVNGLKIRRQTPTSTGPTTFSNGIALRSKVKVTIYKKLLILMSQHVISIRDHCIYAYHRLKESTLYRESSPGHDPMVATPGSKSPYMSVPEQAPYIGSGLQGTKGEPCRIMTCTI